MVELMAILSAMLLLIFGTIQFALIWHAKITLNYAILKQLEPAHSTTQPTMLSKKDLPEGWRPYTVMLTTTKIRWALFRMPVLRS